MVSGGITEYRDSETFNPFSGNNQGGAVDPWPFGIGIYDLSAMEWKDTYDADAAPYVTPELVKASNKGLKPPDWVNDDVKEWFTVRGAYYQEHKMSPKKHIIVRQRSLTLRYLQTYHRRMLLLSLLRRHLTPTPLPAPAS